MPLALAVIFVLFIIGLIIIISLTSDSPRWIPPEEGTRDLMVDDPTIGKENDDQSA